MKLKNRERTLLHARVIERINMGYISFTLPKSGDKVAVIVTRKKMKNIRLKVYRDQRVAVSVPKGVADNWIKAFLMEKGVWIEEKIQQYKTENNLEGTDIIEDGILTKILGQDASIHIEEGPVKNVYIRKGSIVICTSDKIDFEGITRQFEKWWREEAKKYYQAILKQLYPAIGKCGCRQPTLHIRKMKTLWGSCSIGKDKITINSYLFGATPSSIEYVILHELAHMVCPRHDKQFYSFLSLHMPDWQDRKKALSHEVPRVNGHFTYFQKR